MVTNAQSLSAHNIWLYSKYIHFCGTSDTITSAKHIHTTGSFNRNDWLMHNECHFISLIKVFRNSIDRCQMKTMINYLKMRCKHFRVHRRQWWWHVRSLHYVILALWIGGSLKNVTSSHHLNAIYKWSGVQRLRTIFSSTFTFNAHKSIDLVIIFADITRQQYACPIERHFCRAI